MLPARFRSRMHAIAIDSKSGAMELGIKVVKSFVELSRSSQQPDTSELLTSARFLSKAQPSMVTIHNTAEMCVQIIARGDHVTARLRRLESFLENSRKEVAVKSLSLLPPAARVLTLSRSSTVLAALKLAAGEGKLGTLFVMESRPRLEGRAAARELIQEGVECVMVADAMGPSMAAEVDLAVVGADAVLRDGAIVNKIGTYPVAVCFRAAKRQLVVLCESVKLDRRFDSSTWPGAEFREESELLPSPPRGLKALNRYFDLTPPANVHAVVNEGGIFRSAWVASMENALRLLTGGEAPSV